MRTTDNGYRVPQKGDAGNVWSKAIEDNWDRIALHKHDGLDSEKLTIENLTRPKQILDPANWLVNASGSGYVQAVTIPSGLLIEDVNIKFSIKSGPQANTTIYPEIEPITSTSFRCIINDSTLEVEILYT